MKPVDTSSVLFFVASLAIASGCGIHPALVMIDQKIPEIREHILKSYAAGLTDQDRQSIAGPPAWRQAYTLAGDYAQGRWAWQLPGDRSIQADYSGAMNAPLDPKRVTVSID